MSLHCVNFLGRRLRPDHTIDGDPRQEH
jgi:hypothetical protein